MIPIVRLSLSIEGKIPVPNNKIFGCEEAAPIFQEKIGNTARECVAMLCLDVHNNILNYSEISLGKIDKVDVDYATIFKTALLSNAKNIIIAHNHTTSILKPSIADIETTKKLGFLCKMFDMNLIDSLIVGPSSEYVSIRSELSKEKKNDI